MALQQWRKYYTNCDGNYAMVWSLFSHLSQR